MRRLVGKGWARESVPVESRKGDCDDRALAVAPDVRASVHDDGLALLHISTGRVFLCNRTGSRIWQGLVEGLSADAICEGISRDCDVAWELVQRHTSSFIVELEGRGLLIRR
jgi:hypothetical protein